MLKDGYKPGMGLGQNGGGMVSLPRLLRIMGGFWFGLQAHKC